jgi:hypothetical protein
VAVLPWDMHPDEMQVAARRCYCCWKCPLKAQACSLMTARRFNTVCGQLTARSEPAPTCLLHRPVM